MVLVPSVTRVLSDPSVLPHGRRRELRQARADAAGLAAAIALGRLAGHVSAAMLALRPSFLSPAMVVRLRSVLMLDAC